MFLSQTFNQVGGDSKYRKWFFTLLKTVVSVALLGFLFNRIEFFAVWEELKETRMSLMIWAFLGCLCLQMVAIYRWRLLSIVMEFNQTFWQHTVFYFTGLFFNLFLPTTVGGDVGRCYYLAGHRGRVIPALMTILVDRACGVIALMLIASTALFFSVTVRMPAWIVLLTVGLTIVLLAGLMFPFIFPTIFQRVGFPIRYWEHPRSLMGALALSLGIQISTVGINQLIGGALALDIPLGFYFVFTPLVMAVSAVPISLNGLGVREGAYVFLLLQSGIDEASALAFALLWFMLLIAVGFIGGLFWIFALRLSVWTEKA